MGEVGSVVSYGMVRWDEVWSGTKWKAEEWYGEVRIGKVR